MKRIFTLITTLVISLSLCAQQEDVFRRASYTTGRLTVSSTTKSAVKVLVDGASYRSGSDDDIMINNIRPGYHNIKVYKLSKGYSRNWDNNKRTQVIYDANVYIKPQYHVDVTINRFGKAFVDEQLMDSRYNGDDNEGDWNNGNGRVQAMNANAFEQFKQTIKNGMYDDTKVSIAKQGITANNFTSAQAKELVQLFNFDGTRLDIAKYAYKYTIDRQNYFTVVDALTFGSSKQELTKYIQQNP